MVKRILKKILNKYFNIYYGISWNTYRAALSHRSFDSMSSILLWMTQSVNKKYPNFTVDNKDIAEIGSGQFLSHPIGLKLLGARKVVSFDLYRQFNQFAAQLSYKQSKMSKKFFSYCANSKSYINMMAQITETNLNIDKLNQLGIEYKAPYDVKNYSEKNIFDFIISYTVLEHVPPSDIKSLLAQSINILKINGCFCHYIDLEDHRNPENNPFEFLNIDPWNDSDCFSRGNKLRLNHWYEIFNSIDNIEYTFISILERNENLLPEGIEKTLNNYASGILVVGKRIE